MNTPYMKARLADVFQANDADGQLVLVARFDGHASDGAKTDFLTREVTWVVWLRGGRVIAAHRYSGSMRETALREWREIDKMPNTTRLPETDPLGVRGTTWKLWCLPARAATAKGGA
jgi:hypothetical protein